MISPMTYIDSSLCQKLCVAYGMLVDAVLWWFEDS